MAITLKQITGKIVIPGTTTGIRATVTATPMTAAQALTFPADDTLSWGPVVATTDAAGVLPATFKIPTSSEQQAELLWKFTGEPIDKHAGLPKSWLMGYYEIIGAGSVDLADLIELDITTVNTATLVTVQSLVASATAAATASAAGATSSAASAQSAQTSANLASQIALGDEDAALAGVVLDEASTTHGVLRDAYVNRHTSPVVPLDSSGDARRPLGEYVRLGKVVGTGGPGEWDQCIVESAKLLWVPERQQYLIVYTGYDGTPNDVSTAHSPALGFAWSDHRYGPFIKDPANPILAGSGAVGDPDRYGVTGFMGVEKVDGSWTVYSIGLEAVGYEAGHAKLCRYTTPSLADPTWTRHGVAIANGGTDWREVHAWIGSIVEHEGTWHIFLNGTGADFKERVGHASADNVDGPWTITDLPVLDVGATGEWDDKYAAQPDVHRLGDWFYMAYYGYQDGALAQDGLAYCHIDDFPLGPGGKWTKHPSNPIITPGPEGAFDSTFSHKPLQTWFPDEIIHLNTAVKGLGGTMQERSIGMISFGAKHVTAMYPLGDQAVTRSTSSTATSPREAVPASSFLLDPAGRLGLQMRLLVRANPGAGTLTITVDTDGAGTPLPTPPTVVMPPSGWANAASVWVDVPYETVSLFSGFLRWSVTSGTAQLGHAAYELRWVQR